MNSPSINEHFQAIWNRALNATSLDMLTPELIQTWAVERGLIVHGVEFRNVGSFAPTPGHVLNAADGRAFFPTIRTSSDPTWILRRQSAEADAALWEKAEWFMPFWVSMGDARKLLADVRHCSKEQAIERYNYHFSTIYTLAFQAVCIAQIMPAARSLQELCPLAREAYLAFYSGYRASSISALIPAIEGSLTRIVSDSAARLSIPDKVNRAMDRAIATAASIHFDRMWVPREYLTTEYLFGQDERVFAFETIRRWLHKSFFRDTGDYDGATWLNRHLFAHGTADSWQQAPNFSRLVVASQPLGLWNPGTMSRTASLCSCRR